MAGQPRIIAGSAGGRTLRTPRGSSTRPTSARVREALFSALTSRLGSLDGCSVLDLFAGSGALGLEALSRGAHRAVFVDADRGCSRVIRHNLGQLGLNRRAEVRCQAVDTALRHLAPHRFDLVLADPPYRFELPPLVDRLGRADLLSPGGVLVIEHASRFDSPEITAELERLTTRKYGDSCLSTYHVPGG